MKDEGRFIIVYNVGRNLSPQELRDAPVMDIKIRDTLNVLPDLSVNSEDDARKYIKYFNEWVDESELDNLIGSINSEVHKINVMNQELISPYLMRDGRYLSLNDELCFIGYKVRVKSMSKNIKRKLEDIKTLICHK